MRWLTLFFTASARDAGGYAASLALWKYASAKSHSPATGRGSFKHASDGSAAALNFDTKFLLKIVQKYIYF